MADGQAADADVPPDYFEDAAGIVTADRQTVGSGPSIVTLSGISNSPLVRLMAPCSPLGEDDGIGAGIGRGDLGAREPAPLSLRFVTV